MFQTYHRSPDGLFHQSSTNRLSRPAVGNRFAKNATPTLNCVPIPCHSKPIPHPHRGQASNCYSFPIRLSGMGQKDLAVQDLLLDHAMLKGVASDKEQGEADGECGRAGDQGVRSLTVGITTKVRK